MSLVYIAFRASIIRAGLLVTLLSWAAMGSSATLVVDEFYAASRDHYFLTASGPEIDALNSGRIPGWEGVESFLAFDAPVNAGYLGEASPVCRFYIPPPYGDSHFFSASPEECDAVYANYPEFILESWAAFYIYLPDPATGECFFDGGGDETPIYRLWNGRADSNHYYTTDVDARDYLVALGWISEGYGPDGVAMCEPSE